MTITICFKKNSTVLWQKHQIQLNAILQCCSVHFLAVSFCVALSIRAEKWAWLCDFDVTRQATECTCIFFLLLHWIERKCPLIVNRAFPFNWFLAHMHAQTFLSTQSIDLNRITHQPKTQLKFRQIYLNKNRKTTTFIKFDKIHYTKRVGAWRADDEYIASWNQGKRKPLMWKCVRRARARAISLALSK